MNIWNIFQPSGWYLSSRHLYISGISQLLLTRFWPNFKGRFLGQSLSDSNCYGDDIYPGNICPGTNRPYQQYLSCYWADFDQSFWIQFLEALIFIDHNFLDQTSLDPNIFVYLKFFFDLNSLGPDFFNLKSVVPIKFWTYIFFGSNFFELIFLTQILCTSNFWDQKFVFGPSRKIFGSRRNF